MFATVDPLFWKVCEGDVWRYGGDPRGPCFVQFLKYCGLYGDVWRYGNADIAGGYILRVNMATIMAYHSPFPGVTPLRIMEAGSRKIVITFPTLRRARCTISFSYVDELRVARATIGRFAPGLGNNCSIAFCDFGIDTFLYVDYADPMIATTIGHPLDPIGQSFSLYGFIGGSLASKDLSIFLLLGLYLDIGHSYRV